MNARDVAVRRDEFGDRTDERNRSNVIDAIRAIAALMVVFAHAGFVATRGNLAADPKLADLAKLAGPGVLLFFVLSGYLIGGPFIRALIEGTPLPHGGAYLLRRAARIYPAYWVAFAVVLVTLAPAAGVHAYQYPVHFMLLQSSWPVPGEPTALFFVAWTLGIEAAFYLFVPIAAVVLRRLHPDPWRPASLAALVALVGLASAAWSVFGPVWIDGPRFSRPELVARIGLQTWLFAFVPGLLLAVKDVAIERGRIGRSAEALVRRPWLSLPLVAGLWVLAFTADSASPGAWNNVAEPLYSIASGIFIGTLIVAGPWLHPIARVLAPVGLVSYGIYLWHSIVVNLLDKHGQTGFHGRYGALLADFLLVLAITLPLATASWLALERPLMRRAAAWARKRRRPRSAVAPASA